MCFYLEYLLMIAISNTLQLREAITVQVGSEQKEIDVLHWISRAALELVGQAGLGYSFDPLTHNIRNEYADALKSLT